MNNNSNPCVEGEVHIVEDGAKNFLIIESETWDAMLEMQNFDDSQVNTAFPTNKVIPFVKYDNHIIYKSILISELNVKFFV